VTRIALATCRDLPRLTPDDRILRDQLEGSSFEVETALWDADDIHWNRFDLVIIRSCWDYHLRSNEFLTWAEGLHRSGVTLWNPLPVVRWNMHKRYLRDLEAAGVAVVPTCWLPAGSDNSLEQIFQTTGWEEAVVKPAVSASAHQTWRVSREEGGQHEPRLAQALDQGDVMVQRFLPQITGRGEWSLIFLNGQFSHGAIKSPRPGDFRVQPDFGGTVTRGDPGASLISKAKQAMDAVPFPWHYARVDGVETDEGFLLMELELIEPALYFAQRPGAATDVARMIAGWATGKV
jgi:hypothetical protein